ncbi:MAG: arginine repressor [Verrucomicrobia bacterium]|nr:arginine repressor [Verrucomicrobiota bacterium]MDE3046845.1 arginine repressor [Verrucomicrobiota bacterium]
MANQSQDLFDALRALLMGRRANTQEDICNALEKQGYEINQSKVSRLLRKIGAIKVLDTQGQVVYSLPREPGPPSMTTPLRQLILDVVANETMAVVFTSPGSASMIARILDYHLASIGILGTIAGDDTIFVAPKSTKETQKVAEKIKSLLMK